MESFIHRLSMVNLKGREMGVILRILQKIIERIYLADPQLQIKEIWTTGDTEKDEVMNDG